APFVQPFGFPFFAVSLERSYIIPRESRNVNTFFRFFNFFFPAAQITIYSVSVQSDLLYKAVALPQFLFLRTQFQKFFQKNFCAALKKTGRFFKDCFYKPPQVCYTLRKPDGLIRRFPAYIL
ncbi:MAG: hypothetical protein ACLTU3_07580, partial [Acutalibacteraceae bacterium]